MARHMPIPNGTRLEHYEIVGPLGAGGMGEVYRAVDTKLKREVALKILPNRFANDASRLARFEREARLLASLNHPHIAAIYGLGHAKDIRFLVLELVEGPTLADRLMSGRIDVSEALRIATEIAEAMETAHEKGVIHRDLKPANVKLTASGSVKVLDFGLAKALGEPDPVPDPSNSPTVTQENDGVVLGTAAYMSPEQATGKTVDKRTDIWSFGALLYEMLTGRRAFDGKTVSHIIVNVLEKDPDLSVLPPLPAGVQDLLERCLQKDPANRLRDIGDIRVLLQAAITKPVTRQVPVATVFPTRRRSGLAVIGLLAALIVVGLVWSRREPVAPAPEPVRFEISQPGNSGFINLAISPDGRKLVFAAVRANETQSQLPQLWVRSLETLEARPIEGTGGVNGIPFWSADSRYIAFSAGTKLKKVDASGGPVQTLCDIPGFVLGGFWTPDDRIVFALLRESLQQVSAAGGTPVPYTSKPEDGQTYSFPSLLPDGKHYVYTAGELLTSSGGIYIASLGSGVTEQPKRILTDVSPAVYAASPDPRVGYLLFIRGAAMAQGSTGTLMAQRIDTASLDFTGEAIPIAEQVPITGFSASRTGVLVYGTGPANPSTGGAPGLLQGQLTWFDRQGKVLNTVGDPGYYRIPELSPDGSKVALEVIDPQSRNMDLWLFEFARGVNTRFTFNAGREYTPVWSRDGKRIVFASERDAALGWYEKTSNGAGEEQLVFKPPKPGAPSSWSPDGRFLYTRT